MHFCCPEYGPLKVRCTCFIAERAINDFPVVCVSHLQHEILLIIPEIGIPSRYV